MTSEVVILNREAVAIAADSAVTLGVSDPKIYNTANKLFPLSSVEPVAVMALASEDHSDLLDEMNSVRAEIVQHFQGRFDNFLETDHSGPIMSIVEWLPKEELAEMAEALVNLTSFKRRVTPEAETVGGPIDVAVISKGDGLVWVKRKHYFPPELNPRYFVRDGLA